MDQYKCSLVHDFDIAPTFFQHTEYRRIIQSCIIHEEEEDSYLTWNTPSILNGIIECKMPILY